MVTFGTPSTLANLGLIGRLADAASTSHLLGSGFHSLTIFSAPAILARITVLAPASLLEGERDDF